MSLPLLCKWPAPWGWWCDRPYDHRGPCHYRPKRWNWFPRLLGEWKNW